MRMSNERLAPDDARAALLSFRELDASLRAYYADEGLTSVIDGCPFVAIATAEPLLESLDLYCPVVSPGLLAVEHRRSALLAEARDRWGAERIIVRLEPRGLPFRDERFGLLAQYLTKRAQRGEPLPGPDIVPVSAESQAFVYRLLAKAIVNGYVDRRIELDRAVAFVTESYDFGPGGNASALVARAEGRPIGHITWTETVDDVTNQPVCEVVDVYVLEAFEGTGLSRALTLSLENLAAPSGAVLRGNVVRDGAGGETRVVQSLRSAGWDPAFDLWSAPTLAAPQPA